MIEIERHIIPDEAFVALAAGGGGERALRLLVRAQLSKHLLLLRMVVATAERLSHPRATALSSAYEVLRSAQADRPSDIEPLLGYPPVGAWAIRALRDLRNGATVDYGYLTALGASAAVLARADCTIDVPVTDNRVFLPYLGCAYLRVPNLPETATVRSCPDGGEVLAAGIHIQIPSDPQLNGSGWSGTRRLTVCAAGLAKSFLLDDLDPYRLPGGPTVDRLNAAAIRQWHQGISDAWTLLASHHPETAEEVATGIMTIVPLHAPRGHRISATSRHSFGAVALSQPPHGHSIAAALAHEIQHAKLGALLDLVSLIEDSGHTRRYAPWRDEPRPLSKLLEGAYAHLGVTAFWRKQRHIVHDQAAMRAHVEFARWRDETRSVLFTLKASGTLTRWGARFVDGMIATLDSWSDEPIPAAAIQHARSVSIRHRAVWDHRHGQISDGEKLPRD